jgi:hypothetical protein
MILPRVELDGHTQQARIVRDLRHEQARRLNELQRLKWLREPEEQQQPKGHIWKTDT